MPHHVLTRRTSRQQRARPSGSDPAAREANQHQGPKGTSKVVIAAIAANDSSSCSHTSGTGQVETERRQPVLLIRGYHPTMKRQIEFVSKLTSDRIIARRQPHVCGSRIQPDLRQHLPRPHPRPISHTCCVAAAIYSTCCPHSGTGRRVA